MEQPIVLMRTKKSNVPQEALIPTVEPPLDASVSMGREHATPTVEPATPTATAETVTYEEYKRRCAEELAVLAEQARQQGFERGLAEGREQGLAECTVHLDALANLLASARAALDQAIDGIAEVGVEVVCEAVGKIVGQAAVERNGAFAIMREVIRRAKERSRLVVRVSPRDYEMLDGCRDRLIEGLSVGSVEIVADDRVRLGGCLLETPVGSLDGRLEVQIERLRETLIAATPASHEAEAVA